MGPSLSAPPTASPSTPRVPTGVADFDHLSGGLPAGSVVLLAGEPGAGHHEFALTSAAHLMLSVEEPERPRTYLGAWPGPFVLPRGIVVVSTSRSREQLLEEVDAAFDPTYRGVLRRHLVFHDLSPSYFVDSVVPSAWTNVGGSLLGGTPTPPGGGSGTLGALAKAIEADAAERLVIVDSLTDLLVRRSVETEELLTLVKGLRRRAKAWGGVVYLELTKGVAGAATETALVDSVDGVLSFAWQSSPHHSYRQRTMVIDRFLPVLSRIRPEHQGRFVIKVSEVSGLVTTQYERI
jgi:KaiC/GvpD/RAD55 family RecA-like ATPase